MHRATLRLDVGLSPQTETAELHSQARQAGASGDYKKALQLLAQASKEAQEWPYPLYDAAFTYLLMGELDEALESKLLCTLFVARRQGNCNQGLTSNT